MATEVATKSDIGDLQIGTRVEPDTTVTALGQGGIRRVGTRPDGIAWHMHLFGWLTEVLVPRM